MENELAIGAVGISLLLTIFLRLIYGTFKVSKKAKPWIAIAIGMALSMLALYVQDIELTKTIIAAYIVKGFMTGSTAIGINEVIKKKDS